MTKQLDQENPGEVEAAPLLVINLTRHLRVLNKLSQARHRTQLRELKSLSRLRTACGKNAEGEEELNEDMIVRISCINNERVE